MGIEPVAEIVGRLAHGYFWGWHDEDWDQLRSTLAPDVEFEDPQLGRISGIDGHMALYTARRRFPERTHVAMRRAAHNEDVAFVSYDVYLGHRHKVTVVDQLSVRNGRIVYVLSVVSPWPT